jgi:hypothetical protein
MSSRNAADQIMGLLCLRMTLIVFPLGCCRDYLTLFCKLVLVRQ